MLIFYFSCKIASYYNKSFFHLPLGVCSSVPSGSFLSFYNNIGDINEEELHEILPEKTEVFFITSLDLLHLKIPYRQLTVQKVVILYS